MEPKETACSSKDVKLLPQRERERQATRIIDNNLSLQVIMIQEEMKSLTNSKKNIENLTID